MYIFHYVSVFQRGLLHFYVFILSRFKDISSNDLYGLLYVKQRTKGLIEYVYV